MDDAYLRTRRDDVAHVCARIQRVLMRSERQLPQKADKEPFVMEADDIMPADIILIPQLHDDGFVPAYGRPRSHTTLLPHTQLGSEQCGARWCRNGLLWGVAITRTKKKFN